MGNACRGNRHGCRRTTKCEESGHHDEQEDHAPESRAGIHSERGNSRAGDLCQPLGPARFDYAYFSWLAIRHWFRHARSRPPGGIGDCNVLDLNFADRWDSERGDVPDIDDVNSQFADCTSGGSNETSLYARRLFAFWSDGLARTLSQSRLGQAI